MFVARINDDVGSDHVNNDHVNNDHVNNDHVGNDHSAPRTNAASLLIRPSPRLHSNRLLTQKLSSSPKSSPVSKSIPFFLRVGPSFRCG